MRLVYKPRIFCRVGPVDEPGRKTKRPAAPGMRPKRRLLPENPPRRPAFVHAFAHPSPLSVTGDSMLYMGRGER